jgi:hypothetical protein
MMVVWINSVPTDPYAAVSQLTGLAEVIVDAGKKATQFGDDLMPATTYYTTTCTLTAVEVLVRNNPVTLKVYEVLLFRFLKM